jgi:hypothetical protein
MNDFDPDPFYDCLVMAVGAFLIAFLLAHAVHSL